MAALVLTVVLAAFTLLILTDWFKAHSHIQEQHRYDRASHLRLMKEIDAHGSD